MLGVLRFDGHRDRVRMTLAKAVQLYAPKMGDAGAAMAGAFLAVRDDLERHARDGAVSAVSGELDRLEDFLSLVPSDRRADEVREDILLCRAYARPAPDGRRPVPGI